MGAQACAVRLVRVRVAVVRGAVSQGVGLCGGGSMVSAKRAWVRVEVLWGALCEFLS